MRSLVQERGYVLVSRLMLWVDAPPQQKRWQPRWYFFRCLDAYQRKAQTLAGRAQDSEGSMFPALELPRVLPYNQWLPLTGVVQVPGTRISTSPEIADWMREIEIEKRPMAKPLPLAKHIRLREEIQVQAVMRSNGF